MDCFILKSHLLTSIFKVSPSKGNTRIKIYYLLFFQCRHLAGNLYEGNQWHDKAGQGSGAPQSTTERPIQFTSNFIVADGRICALTTHQISPATDTRGVYHIQQTLFTVYVKILNSSYLVCPCHLFFSWHALPAVQKNKQSNRSYQWWKWCNLGGIGTSLMRSYMWSTILLVFWWFSRNLWIFTCTKVSSKIPDNADRANEHQLLYMKMNACLAQCQTRSPTDTVSRAVICCRTESSLCIKTTIRHTKNGLSRQVIFNTLIRPSTCVQFNSWSNQRCGPTATISTQTWGLQRCLTVCMQYV